MRKQKIQFDNLRRKTPFWRLCIVSCAFVFALFVCSDNASAAEMTAPRLVSPVSGDVVTTPAPKIAGSSDVGTIIQVFIDGVYNGDAVVDGGNFSYKPFLPLSSGKHLIAVRATDETRSLYSAFTEERKLWVVPNPAPVILAPSAGSRLGSDRVWVGGVAQNNSTILVYADGVEIARAKTTNHSTGTGSFSLQISGLSVGWHRISSVARDATGKNSFSSNIVSVNIAPPTPAPTLIRPIVNANSGIERPFISGFAKNGHMVTIVLNGVSRDTVRPVDGPQGVASFQWQPPTAFALGTQKIEAFASDNGKLSNNSAAIYWAVGEPGAQANDRMPVSGDKQGNEPMSDAKSPASTTDDTATPPDAEKPLAVKNATETEPVLSVVDNGSAPEKKEEQPAIPDEKETMGSGAGRIQADDDSGGENNSVSSEDVADTRALNEESSTESSSVKEIAPGAVVRDSSKEAPSDFKFNNSLIIGIVILVFLLLSILVWYIQEKRDQLGDRVVNMFKEDADGDELRLPGDASEDTKKKKDDSQLPPPPPPTF